MTGSFSPIRSPLSTMPQGRRNFLRTAGGSFSALAIAAMESPRLAKSIERDPIRPMAPRPPDRKATVERVIVIFLVGGPSQIDTFDHKPQLETLDGQPVPESFRRAVEATKFANVFHGCEDKLMKSPYRFERYGEMGIAVSELHPHLAKHVDKMCFLHSLQSDSNNHAPSSYQLHTGDIRPGKASFGSWVTYGLGSENQDLPGYVVLFDAGPLGGAANYVNGFLPAAFQPTRLRDQGTPVLDLLPPADYAEGQKQSFELLAKLNREHRDSRLETTDLDARIASYELAYRMQHSALEVGDLSDEPPWLLDAYGVHDEETRTASFARKCLMARRLVERGVRFVQLYDMPDKDGWDAHANLVANHTPRARWTDRPAAQLLADLEQRGLLDSTLVLWISEFGRTPMMQGDQGRQHNAAGFTCWLAGGGVQPGRIGATDEIGLMAMERPIPIRDLHATLLQGMGLDFERLSYRVAGRDERLTGVAGRARPVEGVFRS